MFLRGRRDPILHFHELHWQVSIQRLKQEFRHPACMGKPPWRCLNLAVSIFCWILAESDLPHSLTLHTARARWILFPRDPRSCSQPFFTKNCVCRSSAAPWRSFNDGRAWGARLRCEGADWVHFAEPSVPCPRLLCNHHCWTELQTECSITT